MSGPARLATGGTVDRGRSISFIFDGRRMAGLAGDTLASALLANGVRTVSRSFKYRRPRGVFSAGIEEPNALMQVRIGGREIPAARATVTSLVDGLEASSVSGWPSVSFDLLRAFDFVSPLLAAGFYNKTFMWPSWHFYEPFIRRLAGIGHLPSRVDAARYDTRNAHCDVLVIGAGVAGIQTALAAGAAGERVMLVEQGAEPGGAGRWNGSMVGGIAASRWLQDASSRLGAVRTMHVLTRTTAVGYYDHDVVALVENCAGSGTGASTTGAGNGGSGSGPRERFWIVRAKRVVLATGAIEQPLVFCNNDRPGIMLAGAAHQYLRCQAIAPGRRAVIATNNDSAYALVADLRAAGVEVAAVADSRDYVPQARRDAMRSLGVPLHERSMPVDTSGFSALRSVTLGRLSADASQCSDTRRVTADTLLVSGGWSPALHLLAQAGGKLSFCERTRALLPAKQPASITLAGSAALTAEGNPESIGPRLCPVGNTSRQWVDLRHDVTVSDIELALRENFTSIEHVKRHTTVGMAVDQGKTSTLAAIEVIARARGKAPADLGYTTMRPPFAPVTLGAIAGRELGERFAPSRRSPMHAWHESHGALLEDYGEWKRPAAFVRPGETRHQAILREARAVRTGLGLFDASPLGKIEVHGPDAREFLDRLYINNLATLKPGRARYVLALRESGILFDDGTVTALAPGRMLVTTTSGNALRFGAWMEDWRQCEWPQLRVCITPVTDQWATIALTGASARNVLARLRPECDVANATFEHLGVRETRLLGMPARIYRLSFSGELTYEISVPANEGQRLWDALLEEGAGESIAPYGLEALLLLRLEKGYLHIGTDTDGSTVPDDIGWGRVAAAKSADYVGKRSLRLAENLRPDRMQLIGLAGLADAELTVGCHLRLPGSNAGTDGWISSAGRSVLERQPIAMALLRGGRNHLDKTVTVHDEGRIVAQARIVSLPFFDAAGERMNG